MHLDSGNVTGAIIPNPTLSHSAISSSINSTSCQRKVFPAHVVRIEDKHEDNFYIISVTYNMVSDTLSVFWRAEASNKSHSKSIWQAHGDKTPLCKIKNCFVGVNQKLCLYGWWTLMLFKHLPTVFVKMMLAVIFVLAMTVVALTNSWKGFLSLKKQYSTVMLRPFTQHYVKKQQPPPVLLQHESTEYNTILTLIPFCCGSLSSLVRKQQQKTCRKPFALLLHDVPQRNATVVWARVCC